MLGLDDDAIATEDFKSVICKRGVEHGENLGSNVIDGDFDVFDEIWVKFEKILTAEIVQFGSELYARCCDWVLAI